jgi:hypothetical protein
VRWVRSAEPGGKGRLRPVRTTRGSGADRDGSCHPRGAAGSDARRARLVRLLRQPGAPRVRQVHRPFAFRNFLQIADLQKTRWVRSARGTPAASGTAHTSLRRRPGQSGLSPRPRGRVGARGPGPTGDHELPTNPTVSRADPRPGRRAPSPEATEGIIAHRSLPGAGGGRSPETFQGQRAGPDPSPRPSPRSRWERTSKPFPYPGPLPEDGARGRFAPLLRLQGDDQGRSHPTESPGSRAIRSERGHSSRTLRRPSCPGRGR